MRAFELYEGGWTDTVTQGTKITPAVVKVALLTVAPFISKFNTWLDSQGEGRVRMGKPLGSTAYFQVDDEGKEYGDIDLQVIAPTIEDKNESQTASHYNKLMDKFIATTSSAYVYQTGHPAMGHIIFQIDSDTFVQVDMMWATERVADWARWRNTPEQGIKGLVHGSMYSAFGDVIDVSISTSGAQMKIKDGESTPFARTRKFDELAILSLNIETFGADMLQWMYKKMGGTGQAQMDPELQQHQGLNKANVKIEDLAHIIKGLAKSFALNDMYGKFNLKNYSNAHDLINAFINNFDAKMHKSTNAKKFDKAETPEAIAKVEQTRKQIASGQAMVHKLMKE